MCHRASINELAAQVKIATTDSHHVTVLSDFNLDRMRTLEDNPQYRHHALVAILYAAFKEAGLKYTKTGVTFRSYGQHPKPDGTREHRYSCLDHVYSTSDMEVRGTVLEDSSSDHHPVLAKAVLNICRKPRSGTIRRPKVQRSGGR
jgi:endonuclease/exonuclease/phosphatase family metal-dependent hydrolase